jgi:hypothetical protein
MNRALPFLALGLLACAGSGSGPSTEAPPAKIYLRDGSAPGFDKRDFPGLEPMRTWMRESPYVWVGYYLNSPCYAGVAWTGNRAALEAQGWGLAIIYVGQQAPNAAATSSTASPSTASTSAAPECGRLPLTREQGETDGEAAVAIAKGDGFSSGTTVFLDVERTDPLPPALLDYASGWMTRVLSRGYVAGLYAHKLNANALADLQRRVFTTAGSAAAPPFWVSNSVGFDLGRPPSESGYAFATIWQNPSDASETYGGVTFRIDRNVAAARSPSSVVSSGAR